MSSVWLVLQLTVAGILDQTDYQRDWGRLASRLNILIKSDSIAAPVEQAVGAMQLYWLSGLPTDGSRAAERLSSAIRQSAGREELRYLEAEWLAYHHRPAAAERYFNGPVASDDPKAIGLKADIALQTGRIEEAKLQLEQNSLTRNHWFLLAQYATVLDKLGQAGQADDEYANAEDLLTAKSMRDYAWLELQRGHLALSHGRAEEAERHYRVAMRAYSGYWLAEEYRAEWLAEQQHYDEALSVYRRLALCRRKPELYHALGDLYQYIGHIDAAKLWHDKALQFYLDAATRGDTKYYHHLSALYADAYANGAEAIKWAQIDLQQRPNALTHDALAWAYFRDGQFELALLEMQLALRLRWEDSHLYAHAGMIFLAAGLTEEAQVYLQRAKQINPRYEAFHAHR